MFHISRQKYPQPCITSALLTSPSFHIFCRSIEELEAPDFKLNHAAEKLRQRAGEKERNCEATQNGRPINLKRMQFTFSVDQPANLMSDLPVKKPDLKPSQQFKDTVIRRTRTSTRAATHGDEFFGFGHGPDQSALNILSQVINMEEANITTTKLLTLLNVSAVKGRKRKWIYDELPSVKLNKRKAVKHATLAAEPTESDDRQGDTVVEAAAIVPEQKEDDGALKISVNR